MKDSHRLQALGVLMLALFAWVAFDLGAVKDSVRSFLEARTGMSEAVAEHTPAPAPTLIGHPKARPPVVAQAPSRPASGGGARIARPASIAIDGHGGHNVHVTTWMSIDAKPALKDLDALARVLRLDDRKQDELRRILEDAARDLDDLRHLPNADGQTWHGVVASTSRVGWGAHNTLVTALGDFVDTSLGHRGETYRAEREQLLGRYTQVMRGQLDSEQQNDFDKYDVSRMIDPKGMTVVFAAKRLGTLIRLQKANADIS